MSVRLTTAVLLAGLSLTASAQAEDDLRNSERFLGFQGAETLAPVTTPPATATPVHAEIAPLRPERFLDPQEAETAAMIAVDLAMLQDPAAEMPAREVTDLRLEPSVPIARADVAPYDEQIETASLAPELFLGLHADETFAWIAADLASAGELTTGSVGIESTEPAALPAEQPVARALTDDALAFEEYLIP